MGPSDFAAIAAVRKAAGVGALFLGRLMINVLPYRLNPSSDTDGKWENNEESGAAFATVVNFCLMWSRLSDEERALCPWWHSHCSSLCHIYKPGTKVKKKKDKEEVWYSCASPDARQLLCLHFYLKELRRGLKNKGTPLYEYWHIEYCEDQHVF